MLILAFEANYSFFRVSAHCEMEEESNTICPKIEISFFLMEEETSEMAQNLLCQSDQFSNCEHFCYNTYTMNKKLNFLHIVEKTRDK